MGKKNKFLLVSLQDKQAADLAQVISNSTCRKILDYLSEHDNITESQVSQDLGVPLPTVHYNLQLLVKGGLVKIEEFHYSVKGKEVNHYSLANQYIIIAPKGTHGFKEKLKNILPVGLLALGFTALLQFLSKYFPTTTSLKEQVFTETVPQHIISQTLQLPSSAAESAYDEGARQAASYAADSFVQEAAPLAIQEVSQDMAPFAAQDSITETARFVADEGMRKAAETTVVTKETIVQQIITEPSIWHNIAIWFLMGALFAVAVYMIVDAIRKK